MTNKTNTVEEQIKKILNTGRSGDLDHLGCAEYNPELVGKLVSLFNQYADSRFKKALPERLRQSLTDDGFGGWYCETCGSDIVEDECDCNIKNGFIDEMKSRWEEESK